MKEEGKLDHYIGTATTKKCPDDLEKLQVSAGSWAVFEAIDPFPETLQNVWGVFILNGFLVQNMSWQKVLKYCGMKAKILKLRNLEVRFGFQSKKDRIKSNRLE